MASYSIPVLDLNDYIHGDRSAQDAFVQGIGDALCKVGFFALTGHGVNDGLIAKAYQTAANFFALPDAIKDKYEKRELKGQRGFTAFGREHAKDSKAPDLKEFWHVGRELAAENPLAKIYQPNIWPDELAEFKPTFLQLYHELEMCSLKVLEACSEYIGEPRERLRDIAVDGNSILRLIHYPPVPKDGDPHSVRAAAHEDINLITLLIDATSSGLELLDRENRWVPVVTPRGCIIVDAGDMLQNITNGFFKSTTHRVVNPKDVNETRYSMPFFTHARSEVSLKPLPSCVKKHPEGQIFRDITAGDYLMQRLREIGLA